MSSHLCCALKMIPDFSMKTRKVSSNTFTECFDRKESKLEPVPRNWPGLGGSEVKIYLLLELPVENPTFKIRSFTSAQAQVFRLLGRICGYLEKSKFELLCSWKFDVISPWNAVFDKTMISIVFIETCVSRLLIKICFATRRLQSVLLLAIKKELLNLLSRNGKPRRYIIFVKKSFQISTESVTYKIIVPLLVTALLCLKTPPSQREVQGKATVASCLSIIYCFYLSFIFDGREIQKIIHLFGWFVTQTKAISWNILWILSLPFSLSLSL